MFSAGFKDTSVASFKALQVPLRLALSRTLNRAANELDREIRQEVHKHFAIPKRHIDYAGVNAISRTKSGKTQQILTLDIKYTYRAVPLSDYPFQLEEVTVNNRTSKAVFVRIRKNSTPKLVRGKSASYEAYRSGAGRVPYKGFFQKKKAGFIFERSQAKTWLGSERLPIHALYAPSFTDLLKSPELENYFASSKPMQVIEEFTLRELLNI